MSNVKLAGSISSFAVNACHFSVEMNGAFSSALRTDCTLATKTSRIGLYELFMRKKQQHAAMMQGVPGNEVKVALEESGVGEFVVCPLAQHRVAIGNANFT